MELFSLRKDYRSPNDQYNKEGSPNTDPTLFNKKIWRVNDVAKFLGCSKGHIYNLVSIEMIPSLKKGKFLYFIPSDIFRWLLQGD
ncbi:MAG: hypothetical protein COV37_07695 [Bdellovibrio sp. CG11_big_fil_rev_8_21_14_0_20_39_38]|nr:MAG: hypothetical protein COW78_02725 [Bdellovibrio sp. CG22_combo_CG10-13_8_21_14_all_39_27]PIR35606.1 MAG: hypothetical protein COV37_07695 [Bdellovibrio sp. CG11_big_fil_rev_8_21_14_0_20_39_38]